jgi:CubicO group peptidase (beta-lactamase class C family)
MKCIKVFLILTALLLHGCLTEADPDLKNDFKTFTPLELNDGWVISNPENEGINFEKLKNVYILAHSDPELWQLKSMLVFRNGKLVSESYMKDENDRTRPRAVWSCTKQVIGILTGIAIDKGFINSVDDPIKKYFPEIINRYPDKQDITIRNLLTMQSGIEFNNDKHTPELLGKHVTSSLDFILNLPYSGQGNNFNYNDGNPHLLSAILQKVTGKTTAVWAEEVFFSKLDIKNYSWQQYIDGITLGGYGISIPPRELAKIANCVLNNGIVNGNRIVSSSWINEMIKPKVDYEKWRFGFLWWIDDLRNTFCMWGHGGQYAFVIPNKNLIVVITSEPNTNDNHQLTFDKAMILVDKIINASN